MKAEKDTKEGIAAIKKGRAKSNGNWKIPEFWEKARGVQQLEKDRRRQGGSNNKKNTR